MSNINNKNKSLRKYNVNKNSINNYIISIHFNKKKNKKKILYNNKKLKFKVIHKKNSKHYKSYNHIISNI